MDESLFRQLLSRSTHAVLDQPTLAKGADYREDEVVGAPEVKAWGGQVVLIPLVDDRSTTGIIQRLGGAGGKAPALPGRPA